MTTPNSLLSLRLKELNFQSLQDLWEGAKVSLDSNHYQDAIEDLTAAVAEIEHNALAVTLLKRAVAYSCQGRLEAGIKDAYRVMKLAPSLFEGYFCAGRLLQLAGKYDKAVAVYTKGIGAVSGQCSEYEQLIQAKRAVERDIRDANTVLFKTLPYELLAHIFGDLLAFKDRIQCMLTCHAWEDFILEDLPRVSPQIVLGTMSMSSMTRLSLTVSTSHQGDLPITKGLRTYQVSILPEISFSSLKNALNLLSQDSWCDRISYLNICAVLDFVPETKAMLDRVLQQNATSLKRLIMCSNADARATVDALKICSELSHLVVATRPSFLTNSMVASVSHTSDRLAERLLAGVVTRGNPNSTPMIANTNLMMEQQRRLLLAQLHHQGVRLEGHNANQQTVSHSLQAHHIALKRLELVGVRTIYFLSDGFWERLPNLEHISFKNPVDSIEHVRSITQNIGKFCLKVKTFRYGTGWENTFCNKNDIISVAEEVQEQEGGIREIIVRGPYHINHAHNGHMDRNSAMIIPSLLSENKNCSLLTVLVLQMEMLGAAELEALTNLSLPHLREFQLHQHQYDESHKIRPKHFAHISRNFPVLEKVVLNNVQACDDTVFELSKAPQLRCAHLRVANVLPHLNRGFGAQENISLAQLMALRGVNAGVPLPHTPARGPNMHRYYEASLGVYTKFIKSFTMLTEVYLCGPAVQDSDLYTLVANNRNLSTVSLIHCRSLTSYGIISAFNCSEDSLSSSHPSNIHHITLAEVTIAAKTVVSSLARLSSLRKLTMIKCTDQASADDITTGLQYASSRDNVLKVYCLPEFTSMEGILYECIPGQQLVMTRSVPGASIVKHLDDLLQISYPL